MLNARYINNYSTRNNNINQSYFNRNELDIDIYKSPFNSYRKRSEDEKNYKYDFDIDKLIISDNYRNRRNNILKKDEILLNRERYHRLNNKNKRDNTSPDIILSDFNQNCEYSESKIINNNINYSPLNNNNINTSRIYSPIKYRNSFKKKRFRKKKVNFKKKFVTIINVESYKKYNMETNFFNDKSDAKCTCLIY